MQENNLYTPGCIRTFTGRYVNLADPQLETIFPIDIAVALSRICRFNGHTKRFYSVAEHSVECMNYWLNNFPDDIVLQFKLLMHDAHEAYLGDVVSPLKELIPHYKVIANKMQNVIHQRFGITNNESHNEIIRQIDKEVLEKEWDAKVLNNKGIFLTEKSCVDLFIHHFTRLCNYPHVLQ